MKALILYIIVIALPLAAFAGRRSLAPQGARELSGARPPAGIHRGLVAIHQIDGSPYERYQRALQKDGRFDGAATAVFFTDTERQKFGGAYDKTFVWWPEEELPESIARHLAGYDELVITGGDMHDCMMRIIIQVAEETVHRGRHIRAHLPLGAVYSENFSAGRSCRLYARVMRNISWTLPHSRRGFAITLNGRPFDGEGEDPAITIAVYDASFSIYRINALLDIFMPDARPRDVPAFTPAESL